ncbi:MAG: 1,4-alpha-glucan branching protein GlgB [Eubacteriales bacterium]
MIQKTTAHADTSYPLYLFCQGTNFASYDFLGVHRLPDAVPGMYEYVFRVWAPNADEVWVTGDFCAWSYDWPMTRIADSGVWETCLASDTPLEGSFYKYAVRRGIRTVLKADPYARLSQTLKETASVIWTDSAYDWHDGAWLAQRSKAMGLRSRRKKPHFYPSPMNIYEMHLGSWHTRDDASTRDGQHYLSYREIADRLVPYLREMGYTHVELMPVMEHPFDASWGYQVCGYYAPTSRFGTPDDFRYFVDTLHAAGFGVILDWVPAHFPKDAHGLYEFDGGPLYEYQGKDRMEHAGWGTRCFDVGRNEVQSFLISNALFWLREYHADGLRVDAVASMLYLDFDRAPGEWVPNVHGDNHNLEAVAFFQKLNSAVFAEFPDVLMIAEESTAWPMITKPTDQGGLGFNFKWNMGWANDLYDYVRTDPLFRSGKHTQLTFPLMYAFSENYILPVSHDEVVHGKQSLIDKMFGAYDDKFATMRVFLTYMMTLPGKKLMFMGCEFAQFREWDFENSLEWFMLRYPRHAEMQRFSAYLNHFYLDHRELWEIDDGWDGFAWIDPDDAAESILSYRRLDAAGHELIVLLNFTPVRRDGFRLNVPKSGRYREVLSTDSVQFGGGGRLNAPMRTTAERMPDGTKRYSLSLTLPPLSALILQKYNPAKDNPSSEV